MAGFNIVTKIPMYGKHLRNTWQKCTFVDIPFSLIKTPWCKSWNVEFRADLKAFLPCAMPRVEDKHILLCGKKINHHSSKDPYHVEVNCGSMIHPDRQVLGRLTHHKQPNTFKCIQRATHQPACRHLRAGNTRASTRMACMHRGAKRGGGTFMSCW